MTLYYDTTNSNYRMDDDEVVYRTPFHWRQLIPRLFLFLFIALISLVFSISLAHVILDINLPRTLTELQSISNQLEDLLHSSWTGYSSVTFVFIILYLWQQAFSIPGSVLFNLLAGYLYGITMGTLLTSFLTAGGATLAYGLSMLIGEPFMRHIPWIARKAEPLHQQVQEEKRNGGLFWWLLFARLFPFSPYWFINMVSPLLEIPVVPFFWSTVLGSMPYNLVCAQAGDVLGDLTSTSDIVTVSLVIKLLFVSFISLVPVIWGKAIQQWTRKMLGLSTSLADNESEEKSIVEGDDDLELLGVYSRIPSNSNTPV